MASKKVVVQVELEGIQSFISGMKAATNIVNNFTNNITKVPKFEIAGAKNVDKFISDIKILTREITTLDKLLAKAREWKKDNASYLKNTDLLTDTPPGNPKADLEAATKAVQDYLKAWGATTYSSEFIATTEKSRDALVRMRTEALKTSIALKALQTAQGAGTAKVYDKGTTFTTQSGALQSYLTGIRAAVTANNQLGASLKGLPKINLSAVMQVSQFVTNVTKAKTATADMKNKLDNLKKTEGVSAATLKSFQKLYDNLSAASKELEDFTNNGLSKFEDAMNSAGESTKTFGDKLASALGDFGSQANSIQMAIGQLFSTSGGIISGITTVIGAALGSMVPGLGTAMGGFVGSIVGGMAESIISGLSSMASGILGTVGGIVNGAIQVITAPIEGFFALVGRIGEIAIGYTVGRGILYAFNQIRDAINGSFEAGVRFQNLIIRLQTVKSIEFIRSGEAEDIAQGLEMAVQPANDLFFALQKMAITTPFSTETIMNTFAFAKTMKITDEQAMKMTQTITNFVAGMGLWPETMQRIIINFQQMAAASKVTGTEIRDLARGAMFPILDIMDILDTSVEKIGETTGIAADKIRLGGMTLEEFRAKVKDNTITVNDFISAFMKFSDTYFGTAAERASKTIAGITENFNELITTMLGGYTLAPMFDTISVQANDMIQGLLANEDFVNMFRNIGSALDYVYTMVSQAIAGIIPSIQYTFGAISSVISSFVSGAASEIGIIPQTVDTAMESTVANVRTIGEVSNPFKDFATGLAQVMVTIAVFVSRGIGEVGNAINSLGNLIYSNLNGITNSARSWGSGFVQALSSGIIAGAQALINAISYIASIISYFFKPGSPPRVAPDIDKWGEETGELYASSLSKGAGTVVVGTKLSYDIYGGEHFTGKILTWGKAVVDTFRESSLVVRSFYNSLEGLGKGITAENITKTILDMRNALRDAVDSVTNGSATISQALGRAFSTIGFVSNEVKKYIDYSLQMAAANAKIAKAQELVNSITKRYDAILKPLQARLEEIKGQSSDLDDTREISRLQLIEKDPNATRDEKERARLRIEELNIEKQIRAVEQAKTDELEGPKGRLELAQEEADILQEQLELYKAIVDEQITNNDLLKTQWEEINKQIEENTKSVKELSDSLKEASSAAGGGGGGGGGGGDAAAAVAGIGGIPGMTIPKFNIEDWLNLDEMKKKADEAFSKIKDSFDGMVKKLDTSKLKVTLANLFDDTDFSIYMENPKSRFEEFRVVVKLLGSELKNIDWGGVATGISDITKEFADWFTGQDWKKNTEDFIKLVKDIQAVDWGGIVQGIKDTVSVMKTLFNLIPPILITEWIKKLVDSIDKIDKYFGGENREPPDTPTHGPGPKVEVPRAVKVQPILMPQPDWAQWIAEFKKNMDIISAQIPGIVLTAIQNPFVMAFTGIGGAIVSSIVQTGSLLINAIGKWDLVQSAKTVITKFLTGLTWENLPAKISKMGADIITEIGKYPMAQGAIDTVKKFVDAWSWDTLWPKITQFGTDIKEKLAAIDLTPDGKLTVQGFIDGMTSLLEEPAKIMGDICQQIIDAVTEAFDMGSPSKLFFGFGEDLIQGLLDGMSSIIDLLVGKVDEIVTAFDKLNTIGKDIPKTFGEMVTSISSSMATIKTTITNSLTQTQAAIIAMPWNGTGTTVMSNFATGVTTGSTMYVLAAVKLMCTNAHTAITTMPWVATGLKVMGLFKDGINSGKSIVISAVKTVCDAAITKTQEGWVAAGITSMKMFASGIYSSASTTSITNAINTTLTSALASVNLAPAYNKGVAIVGQLIAGAQSKSDAFASAIATIVSRAFSEGYAAGIKAGGSSDGNNNDDDDQWLAVGGPVTKGDTYVVGEKGPELFVPNNNGTIIPNNELQSSGTIINKADLGSIVGDMVSKILDGIKHTSSYLNQSYGNNMHSAYAPISTSNNYNNNSEYNYNLSLQTSMPPNDVIGSFGAMRVLTR